jgi:uncharacterized protein YecA (UPF0149 family)
MRTRDFLTSERDHAQRHLARIRRIQESMRTSLEAAALDELTVYERLIANKAYRQLQRDEAFYQQMWLRLSRHLDKLPNPVLQKIDDELDSIERDRQAHQAARPQTVRYATPPPTRNQACPCGSSLKYKRCCGNPLKQAAPTAAPQAA